MLEELVKTIECLKKRIKEHKDHIQNYESRTRATLIDPVLCALGWDVSEPTIVIIEPKGPGGWADYALLGNNGKTVIMFIEAKKLSDKDIPISQTVGYAVSENIQNNANIRYCAGTNGDTWELYDVVAQKTVLKTSIVSDEEAKCALQLLGLWRRSMADGLYAEAVHPVVPNHSFHDPTSTPFSEVWTALNRNVDPTNKPPPTSMKLPDGREATTKYWRDVIAQMAAWLQSAGLLTKENCQIPTWQSGNTVANRYILSRDGKHPDGTQFFSSHSVGDGIILETHLSSKEVVRRSIRMLEHCGQDPSQVLLRLP